MLGKGYEVFGLYRRVSTPNFWRLQSLGVYDRVHLIPGDMTDMSSILEAVAISRPDEIYNLAAQSFVESSFEKPLMTTDVDGLGVVRLLEVVRTLNRDCRLYQASTSEIYGNSRPEEVPLNEETSKRPASPYGAAKLYSYNSVRIYREGYKIHASNGILFNHESPLRGLEFVTRKVTNAVAKIKLGIAKDLTLGKLDVYRDWGYAAEYVEAMWAMTQQEHADDYVIATNEVHSVGELVKVAFDAAKLDWRDSVNTSSRFHRPVDINHLRGDASKAKRVLGWHARTGFHDLIRSMVEADLSNWERHLKGESFPWDAPNYPNETRVSRMAGPARR